MSGSVCQSILWQSTLLLHFAAAFLNLYSFWICLFILTPQICRPAAQKYLDNLPDELKAPKSIFLRYGFFVGGGGDLRGWIDLIENRKVNLFFKFSPDFASLHLSLSKDLGKVGEIKTAWTQTAVKFLNNMNWPLWMLISWGSATFSRPFYGCKIRWLRPRGVFFNWLNPGTLGGDGIRKRILSARRWSK